MSSSYKLSFICELIYRFFESRLLNQKRKDITALLKDGIVNDSSYGILDSKISEYTDEIGTADELSKEKKGGSPI
jgi:hypothetical protein